MMQKYETEVTKLSQNNPSSFAVHDVQCNFHMLHISWVRFTVSSHRLTPLKHK